jgi:hypothetical protein
MPHLGLADHLGGNQGGADQSAAFDCLAASANDAGILADGSPVLSG